MTRSPAPTQVAWNGAGAGAPPKSRRKTGTCVWVAHIQTQQVEKKRKRKERERERGKGRLVPSFTRPPSSGRGRGTPCPSRRGATSTRSRGSYHRRGR